jgi:hypothetical protein
MYKSDKPIDSKTFIKIEQEIYDRTINYSNKYEVILKLNELKGLSENELRAIMPWELINKQIGFKQIVFSWIKDTFVRIKGIINRNKYVVNNDSLEFLKPNSENAYNLTYKYYVKTIFDRINNDIKGILDKHEINYVYLYPHEVSLEKPEPSPDVYSSEETKKWDKKEEIVDLFQVAIWIITIGWFYKVVVDFDFNILGKIIFLLSGVSIPTLYRLIQYYIKVRKIISGYKDKIVVETKNRINSDLQPETVTSYILDGFFDRVVKEIKGKKLTNHKYLKITTKVLSVILVIVIISYSFIDNQVTSTLNLNQPNSGTFINETHAPKKDVEKYLQTQGILPLLSNEPMPEEEIKFVKEKITGKVSSVTMNLSLDCSSIKVKTIDEKGNIKIEASINLKIKANGWEITNGTFIDLNESNTLKEKYKDRLGDEIQEIYQSKKSVIDTFDKIKKRAKIEAIDKINDLIKNQYPDINEIEDIKINYQTDGFDMSGTELN